jgi:hypothetical protein
MNKKGQELGFIKVLAVSVVFIVIFAIGLAPMVSNVLGGLDLSVYGGIGAWFIDHLNIWFLGFFTLAILIALVYGFSSE